MRMRSAELENTRKQIHNSKTTTKNSNNHLSMSVNIQLS